MEGLGVLQQAGVGLVEALPRCHQCGLATGCISPKMPWTGQGRRQILVVAEAPGSEEDRQGVQLIGPAGQELRRLMGEVGLDLDRDCWKTNAVICRPSTGNRNETPTALQIESCRPNLLQAIKELQPRVVLLLGASAIQSLIGLDWPDPGPVSRWVGSTIPHARWGAWLCPLYHPSYLLRVRNDPELGATTQLWFLRHLQQALELGPLPQPVIDPTTLELIDSDLGRVAAFCHTAVSPIAIDYETNMLKPDGADAEIVCCALSDGQRTLAFPWVPQTIRPVGELLRSDVSMIAANLKFEERWTRDVFGHGARNWCWDTMQAAHVLDQRRGITGVKFQAYIEFGVPPYDLHIEPYLISSGPRLPNRIWNLEPRKLLRYNAMDALIEWHLAQRQMDRLGCKKAY